MKKLNIAVVGATGAVGNEILKVLETRSYLRKLKLLASSRSSGLELRFQGLDYQVETVTPGAFRGIDAALFAGGEASKEFAYEAVLQGAVVIDIKLLITSFPISGFSRITGLPEKK
ncbi:MAG: aspartate-semialdehyde dehydrogenase [Peptococcaceae bacterium]|jgi:aspartate-semialdehyde dehydrogenase|nr:aspartate-semialdehyde dehydrogenase [Peptococcaceae bacterium]